MLQYFVPAFGPAPKWCAYLETITEELEESEQPAGQHNVVSFPLRSSSFMRMFLSSVYDDYKFVTATELEQIGLTRLVGTKVSLTLVR